MLRLLQTFFDQGEKSGKLLAWQIKQLEVREIIPLIKNKKGDTITEPTKINKDSTMRNYMNPK